MTTASSRHRQPVVERLEARQLLAAGAPDTSFSGDGKATIDLGSGAVIAAADVAVQSDGKTVVVGTHTFGNVSLFMISRFNLDGTLDTSFGGLKTGSVFLRVGTRNFDAANCVAIQGDGKILVAGTSDLSNSIEIGKFNYS